MAKGQYKIGASYEKDIKDIKKLLKEYNVQITSGNTLLNQHIIDFKQVVEKLEKNDLTNKEEVVKLHSKIDEILNIKVNGTIGLKNVLTVVYESTAKARSTQKVIKSIKEWTNNHKTIKTLAASKPVRIVFTGLVTLFLMNLVKILFGIDLMSISKLF